MQGGVVMEDAIIISKLSFDYDGIKLFDNFNLRIKKGNWTTLIGPNGSGKSTLIKILLGFYPLNTYVNISKNAVCKDNYRSIRSKVGAVFEKPDSSFVAETVIDEIAFAVENKGLSKKEIEKRINYIVESLDLEDILECYPETLSGGQKQLVALAGALVIKPKVLLLDEAMTMIDERYKNKVVKLLKKLNEEDKVTILNVTHDPEDCLLGNEVVVLDQGKLILQDTTINVFKQDKILLDLGLDLLFMVKLSSKLKYYGLVKDIELLPARLVDEVWK